MLNPIEPHEKRFEYLKLPPIFSKHPK